MFTTFQDGICYNIITKKLRKSILLRIMERCGGSENSFEVRLTSSRTRQRDRQSGVTWGVYAIDSMDALARNCAHCPRLRAEARGEWHFPANVSAEHLYVVCDFPLLFCLCQMYCGCQMMSGSPVRFCMIRRMRQKFLSIIGSGLPPWERTVLD